MQDVKRWYIWIMAILVLHMAEQFMFGIDELYEVKAAVAAYQNWFGNADYATVFLVLVGGVTVQFMVLAGLAGGKWTLIAPGIFALEGFTQIHHIAKTISHGAYFPGTFTAIPYVPIAVMLLIAVVREFHAGAPVALPARAVRA